MSGTGVAGDVRRKLEQAWKLLEAQGSGAAVANIRDRLDDEAGATPSVVVVGETKRGKSSLINALVGDQVAAVGVDVVTGAYVTYVPPTVGSEIPPGVARIQFADETSVDVALAELDAWVTVDGPHADDDRGVASAMVHLQRPGHVDVVFVDTPGVGGLVAGHRELALRAAAQATALLFVTDAGQDLTVPELRFLEQASEAVATVVLAYTKIDRNPASWELSLEHDRSLLARHAPRFAGVDMVGVSSTMAAEASTIDDAELADEFFRASRIGELAAVITARMAVRSEQLASNNALRATVTELQQTAARLGEHIAAIKSATATSEAATDEQQQLRDLKKHQQRWGRDFDLAMNRARRSLVEECNRTIAELEHAWRARVADLAPAVLRDASDQRGLVAALAADVSAGAEALLQGYADTVAEQVRTAFVDDLERGQALSYHVSALAESSASGPTAVPDLAPVAGQPLGQHLLRSSPMGFVAANMAGAGLKMAGLGAAGGTAGGFALLGFWALPLAAGVAVALAFRSRETAEAEGVRRQLNEHVGRTLARTQQAVLMRADAIASELRPRLLDAMEEYVEFRLAQLSEVIAEAKQAARAEPMERAKRVQPLQRVLNTISAAITDLESTLVRSMAGTPGAPGASKQQPGNVTSGSSW